jgi:DNA (cytosine-5)-methyltransferase 1
MRFENNGRHKIVALDLFCGAGGLTKGLLDAGIDVRLGIDNDDRFRKTYEFNNDPAIFRKEDVRSLSGIDLERDLSLHPEELFFLAACAPCQPFSKHNKNHRYDRKKSLLLQVGRILSEFQKKPDFLFFENVPGITKIDGGRIFKEFCKVLSSLGYNFNWGIMNAKDYGIPQSRKRFIMIGIKRDLYDQDLSFPNKTHGKGLLPYKTVRDTIGHLPSLRAGQRHETIANHQCASLEEINLERLAVTPKNGGSRDSWPESLRLKCHIDHKGHRDVYGRMSWDSPSPTLTCKCTSISNGRFAHPTQRRAISLREAALLQTFPENYIFFGLFQVMAKQIGNAVPVKLAEIFGRYLISLLDQKQNASPENSGKTTNIGIFGLQAAELS